MFLVLSVCSFLSSGSFSAKAQKIEMDKLEKAKKERTKVQLIFWNVENLFYQCFFFLMKLILLLNCYFINVLLVKLSRLVINLFLYAEDMAVFLTS